MSGPPGNMLECGSPVLAIRHDRTCEFGIVWRGRQAAQFGQPSHGKRIFGKAFQCEALTAARLVMRKLVPTEKVSSNRRTGELDTLYLRIVSGPRTTIRTTLDACSSGWQ